MKENTVDYTDLTDIDEIMDELESARFVIAAVDGEMYHRD